MDRSVLRWLLRPWSEPLFLRLALAEAHSKLALARSNDGELDQNPLCRPLFAFDLLPATRVCPNGVSREEARRKLVEWGFDCRTATEALTNLLQGLRQSHEGDQKLLRELARSHSLPEFFEAPAEGGNSDGLLGDYHELHAHFRGSVPCSHLLRSWLRDHRHRAKLRKQELSCEGWSCTIAELLEAFDELQPSLSRSIQTQEPADRCAAFEQLVGVVLQRERRKDLSSEESSRAVAALCIATSVRTYFIYGANGQAPGLASFVEAYGRFGDAQKRATRDEHRELTRTILERFEKEGVAAVELRPTFERRPLDLHRRLWAILDGYVDYLAHSTSERPLALGLVVSLYKQEAPKADDEDRIRVWTSQVKGLLALLDEDPILRWFVVGIDVAGAERGCPPRALLPAFEQLRRWHDAHGVSRICPGVDLLVDKLRDAARKENRKEPFHPRSREVLHATLPRDRWFRLGRTFHAGEDFADPTTGLRHIHEVLSMLEMKRGDRLGHALAAALEQKALTELLTRRSQAHELTGVRRLSDGTWRIRKPVGVHLLDLALTAELLDEAAPRQELTAILARAWTDPRANALARRQLRPNQPLAAITVPNLTFSKVEPNEPEGCLWVEFEPQRFEALRQRVLAAIIERNVVIESCPTSNVVVADLKEPPIKTFVEIDGLRVAVATDDPGLFDAWPRGEFKQVDEIHLHRLVGATRAASFVRSHGSSKLANK